MTAHLSTLVLHQLRYGELDGETLSSARAHLQRCPRCAARLQVQRAERAAFVLRPVPESLHSSAPAPTPGWLRWWIPAGLAATLGLILVLSTSLSSAEAPGDIIRPRGALPDVEVWLDSDGGPRLLRSSDRLEAGSRVQLKYRPHGASHVAFAGRDGAGLIAIYGGAAVSGGEGLIEAPFALTLDGTPGDQELFVVTADHPLDEEAVRAAVRGGLDGARVVRTVVPKR